VTREQVARRAAGGLGVEDFPGRYDDLLMISGVRAS
jgi:hypothetical protein